MAQKPQKSRKPSDKQLPRGPRPSVIPLTSAAIAKRLKLKSARHAEKWCADNGIPAFSREQWKASYGADPGGSASTQYYHPGMVEALIEDHIIEQERAKAADATKRRRGAAAPPPFDDDSDNF